MTEEKKSKGWLLASPKRGVWRALKVMWREKKLCAVMFRQELRARYLGSSLGGAWNWLMPLMMLAVYALVFGQVLQAKWPQARTESQLEFVATLFAGLLVINFFADMVSRAANSLAGHANLIKKVVFPVQILAVGLAGVASVNALVSVLLLLGLLLVSGAPVWLSWMALPVILLPVGLLGLACTWVVSASAVYIKDIGLVVQAVLTALVFLTPVFYPMSAIPESWRTWMALNPLALVVEQLRGAALHGQWPQWDVWALLMLASALLAVLGLWWFERLRDGFADVL